MSTARTNVLSFDSLGRALRQKEIAQNYLFHGEEDFHIEEGVSLLVKAAITPEAKDFNLDVVSGGDCDARSIASLASAFPLMSDRRVVMVRDFDKLSNKDPLLSYLANPSPSTVLILVSTKPDFRTAFFKKIKEYATVVECKFLPEKDVPSWIAARIEQRGKTIDVEAGRQLQTYVGRSLREIENEIDKLLIFIGSKASIGIADVNAVVGLTKQYNIFELQKAIGGAEVGRASDIMDRMLAMGERPLGMIIMLTKYFQKLWTIQDCLSRRMNTKEIGSVLKMSERQFYYLEEEMRRARELSQEDVERAFASLVDADERLKTSAGDERLVMTLLLTSLVKRDRTHRSA